MAKPNTAFINITPPSHRARSKPATRKERQQHCEQWRHSGLSMSEYCRRQGISVSCLSQWVKRTKETPALPTRAAISPVTTMPSVEIRLANGMQLLFPDITDAVSVAQLIKACSACN